MRERMAQLEARRSTLQEQVKEGARETRPYLHPTYRKRVAETAALVS